MEILQLANTYSLLEAYIKLPKSATFFKDTFFPTRLYSTNEFALVDFRKSKRVMAQAVDEEVGHSLVERQAFVTEQFWTPFFAPTRQLKAMELKSRHIGDSPFADKTTVQRAAEYLALDMIELDDILTRREEWMCVQSILLGTYNLPIATNQGLKNYTIDLTGAGARPGPTLVTLSSAAKWNQSTSNPLGDLATYATQTWQYSLVRPDICVMEINAWNAFLQNANVDKVFYSFRGDSGSSLGIVKPDMLSDSVYYVGSLRFPRVDVYVYSEYYVADGTTTENPMLPNGTVIIGSTKSKNSITYGPITQLEAQAGGEVAEFTWSNQPRVPKVWVDIDHDSRWQRMAMRVLPAGLDLSEWTVLTVL